MKLMNDKKRLGVRNRLFIQICVGFGCILILFVLLIGSIYTRLYENSIIDTYRKQLKSQAKRISKEMSIYVKEKDADGCYLYQEYLDSIAGSENTDIWLIDNGDDDIELGREFTNVDIEQLELSKEVEEVLAKAKLGTVAYACGYDKIYGRTMMCVAAPIRNKKRQVVGIVLLNSFVTQRDALIESSRKYILASMAGGGCIAIFLAAILALVISKPIARMRHVSVALTMGEYEKRTNIHRNNEIGVLARSMDTLAERLQKNEEERQAMEQARIDFFANVSHELRTPITVVRGYAESLLDGVVPSEEKKQQYYRRMVGECQSMERLVGDLLTLSKVQNPHFEVEKEPINLVQVFQDILRGYKSISEKQGIGLSLQCEKDLLMIMGDYDRLRQLFINIVDNAIKFSPAGKTVWIEVDKAEDIVVKIRDEGIGIGKDELPFIFEKFYKSKLRQNAKGSGLGLVIAKYIVEKHEGTISVKSELGVGTEFEFHFKSYEGDLEGQ